MASGQMAWSVTQWKSGFIDYLTCLSSDAAHMQPPKKGEHKKLS